MTDKPRIVVISCDDADQFDWLSDGWYQEHQRGTLEAECLMRRARRAIKKAINQPQAVKNLEAAGFEVIVRNPEQEIRQAINN